MMIIYGNGQTYLPLSIVYVKPYNEAADMVINNDAASIINHSS